MTKIQRSERFQIKDIGFEVYLAQSGKISEMNVGFARDMDIPKRSAKTAVYQFVSDVFHGKGLDGLSRVDETRLTPFQQKVFAKLLKVAPGSTVTYGELARQVGKPGAARAVGRAMATNPFPILIPCHRVLGARGQLGGYTCRVGGTDVKRKLLDYEAIFFK